MSKRELQEVCVFCVVTGRYVGWALLIFGGIVGGLPELGFPHPAPIIERLATYSMASGLLIFVSMILFHRFVLRHAR